MSRVNRSIVILLMPYTYVIHKERRLVVSTASGRVTFAEITAHLDQVVREPDFHPTFNHFIDWTAATSLDISADEAQAIAKRRDFAPPSRRAFLATAPSIYGMLRLTLTHHEMSGARELTCVFYDRKKALAWLGLEGLPDFRKPEARKPGRATDEKSAKDGLSFGRGV